MNSPQSQNDALGSMVIRYVTAATTVTAAATMLFHSLNPLSDIIPEGLPAGTVFLSLI